MAARPGTWLGLAAFTAAGMLAGVLLGALLHGSSGRATVRTGAEQLPATATTPTAGKLRPPASTTAAPARIDPSALSGALSKGAADVRRLGLGTAELALMLDTDATPLVRGAAPDRRVRLWSMVKPVTAVALLKARGNKVGGLERYLRAALLRSENCAQRKLVLELQRAQGGIDAAKRALRDTLVAVGGQIETSRAQISVDGRDCRIAGFESLSVADAGRQALFAGTSNWRISDAVRFAHGLRDERVFSKEISDRILGLMRAPKLASREPGADSRITAPLEWGAGSVFRSPCWHVAYKGGWGRNVAVPFSAGQLGSVELANGRWAAFAVVFHPTVQPIDSDPGKALAPEALGAALAPLRRKLQKLFPGACR